MPWKRLLLISADHAVVKGTTSTDQPIFPNQLANLSEALKLSLKASQRCESQQPGTNKPHYTLPTPTLK